MEGVARCGDVLASEDAAEYADRQKEVSPGGEPTGEIWCEAAGCKAANLDAMCHVQKADVLPSSTLAESTCDFQGIFEALW